jgi:hypothetical protein
VVRLLQAFGARGMSRVAGTPLSESVLVLRTRTGLCLGTSKVTESAAPSCSSAPKSDCENRQYTESTGGKNRVRYGVPQKEWMASKVRYGT